MSLCQRAVPSQRRVPLVFTMLQDPVVRVPLTYFVALQLLDTVTTAVGLVWGLHELNPVTLRVIESFGTMGLLVQKMPVILAAVLAAAVLPRRSAAIMAWTLSALIALALGSNVVLVFAAR